MRYIFNFENEEEYNNYDFLSALDYVDTKPLSYCKENNTIKKEILYNYVNYLTSENANSYITLNIVPNNSTGIAIHVESFTNTDLYFIGTRNDKNNTRWCIGRSSIYYYGYGNYSNINNATDKKAECFLNFENDKKFVVTNLSTRIDITNLPVLSFTPTGKIRISGCTGYAGNTSWTGKIYYVKITQGTETIVNLVPIRKKNIGYFYDTISHKLYKSEGSSNFVLGEDTEKIYDSKIEYIEGTGTQWIDTEYIIRGTNIRIEGKFTPKGYTGNYGSWFSCYTGEDYRCYRIIAGADDNLNTKILANSGKKAAGGNISVESLTDVTTVAGQVPYEFILTYDNLLLSINGGEFEEYQNEEATISTIENFGHLSLFKTNINGNYGKGCFYYLKVYKDNKLVLDLIPVRVGNTGCIYDKISQKIFKNKGTGNFGVGPDV